MQLSCPCCHARFPFEAALQDESARELLGLMATMPAGLSRPLVAYLGLFRAAGRQLAWDRALRLARETLATTANVDALEAALVETVATLDEKRAQPGWKPLTAHNYLKRVLESVEARLGAGSVTVLAPVDQAPRAPTSKAGQAMVALQGMKRG